MMETAVNAWHNLKQIARNNKARLIGTFTLVLAKNLLLLTYPVFGGFAINGVLEGNLWKALSYAAVILVIWTVGSVRRAVDTRAFSRIYAEMVVPVILQQRRDGEAVSTISARAALSRELVDFFRNAFADFGDFPDFHGWRGFDAALYRILDRAGQLFRAAVFYAADTTLFARQ